MLNCHVSVVFLSLSLTVDTGPGVETLFADGHEIQVCNWRSKEASCIRLEFKRNVAQIILIFFYVLPFNMGDHCNMTQKYL